MSDITRRVFVLAATATICGCGAVGASADPPADAKPLDLGEVKDFDKDGVFDKFAKSKKILIVRDNGKLYAVSSICTHKACGIKPELAEGGGLKCPCHGSSFSMIGEVKKGPAKQSLAHLAIALDDQKHVTVDTTKKFDQDHWNDDGAVVHV
jgi:Rieske Fe-S protein